MHKQKPAVTPKGRARTGALDEPTTMFCGSLVDGTGGPILERVLIRVKDGTIIAIEKLRGGDSVPPGVEDWSEYTLVPGFVDCHVHLFMSGTSDPFVREKQLAYSFDKARVVIARHLLDQLRHGIIVLRDGGDYGGHALRFKKEEMARSQSPLLLHCAGRAWHRRGRYGRLIGRSPAEGTSLAQAILADNKLSDHIKIVNSGINSLTEFGKETLPQFSLEELTEAVKAAEGLGLTTMVHANGHLPVGSAARAGCHSIEHGFFMGEDNLRLLADRQIYWVPTACTMKAYAEEMGMKSLKARIAARNLENQLEQIRLARQFGVPLALGTDCGSLGVHHGTAFVQEMKLFLEAGFTLPEVIRCATLNGAKLLGISNETGQLKMGKAATFILTKGNPSALPESLKSPEGVYCKGKRAG